MIDLTFTAKSENDEYAKQINSLSGIVVFISKTDDHEPWTMEGVFGKDLPCRLCPLVSRQLL